MLSDTEIDPLDCVLQCLGLLEDHLQLLYLRSTMLQEVVYQWRNGYNALDDRRFLNDPKSLAAEIRYIIFSNPDSG